MKRNIVLVNPSKVLVAPGMGDPYLLQMPITTVALDLDGTLLDSAGEVSTKNRHAIERAAEQGISVLICTGRHHLDASWIAEKTKAVSYVVSSNGAYAADSTGMTVYEHPFCAVEACNLEEAFKASVAAPICYTADGIIIDETCPALDWYKERDSRTGHRLGLSIHGNPFRAVEERKTKLYKVAVISIEADSFGKLERELELRGIAWTHSSRYNREIMASGASKAMAVGHILKIGENSFSELLAIGDGANDIELIKAAGYGIAMGNGCDELKSVARGVCRSNSEDGVAETINSAIAQNLDTKYPRITQKIAG